MRIGLRWRHPSRGWVEVTSVRMIPANEPMSDAGLRKYADIDPDSADPKTQRRARSLKGPHPRPRAILGYRKRDGSGEAYLIVPLKILGRGTP